jgi:hypothetical protein
MKSILAWLAVSLVAYGAFGLGIGHTLRPAVEHYTQTITAHVSNVPGLR